MKFDENIKSVREAFDVVYNNMSDYMDRYNELENEIQENYYSKEKILKALGIEYREQDLSEDRICCIIEAILKEKRRVEKKYEQSQEILSSIKIAYMVHTKDCELLLKDIEKWEEMLDK